MIFSWGIEECIPFPENMAKLWSKMGYKRKKCILIILSYLQNLFGARNRGWVLVLFVFLVSFCIDITVIPLLYSIFVVGSNLELSVV